VRYAGTNRFGTAAITSASTFAPGVPVAFIAYAYNFPDALAGAAAAGHLGGPVLYSDTTGTLNSATATELTRLKPAKIVVLGGTSTISASIMSQLAAYLSGP
jgi:putative cell wall-binding protein